MGAGGSRLRQQQEALPTARAWYWKALTLSQQDGSPGQQAAACAHLGDLYRAQRRFGCAQEMLDRAWALYQEEEEKDLRGLGDLYYYLGTLRLAQGDLAQAETCFRQGLVYAEYAHPIIHLHDGCVTSEAPRG